MKIKFTLLMCLFMVQKITYAQIFPKKSIALSIGLSVPTFDYADKDYTKETSGLAGTGFSFDVKFDYKIKSFGLTALLRNATNSYDKKIVSEAFNQSLGSGFNVTTGNYNATNLMVGAFYTFPIRYMAELNFKVMGGGVNFATPSLQTSTVYQGNSYYYNVEKQNTLAFAYLVGINLKVPISKKLFFVGNGDWTNSKIKVDASKFSTNLIGVTTDVSIIKYSTINLSAGVAYYL